MRKLLFLSAVLLLATCFTGRALAQETHVAGLTGDAHRGKELFRRYCIGCHGVRGDGAGENAPWVDPKPRDFTGATFKCRSTPTGTLPTDEDLYNTIARGMHASGMPSWQPLTKQQRVDLVAYIKSFSQRFQEEKAGTPIAIPAETPATHQSVERGGELFQKMNCWSCHGVQGRGNGPSAISLTDSKGYPITPYDFTSASRFKCGKTSADLYRVLMTGLDGTPMPSFGDALKPDQVWDLVHYVQTFRLRKPPVILQPAGAVESGEGGNGNHK